MLQESQAVMNGLIAALHERDNYTRQHSDRVVILSARLGVACGIPEKEIVVLKTAALFHDIGKIGVPDRVLLKQGSLTDEEWLEMQQHPIQGERIFRATGLAIAQEVAPIILHHHEAFNGEGYPDRLTGESIPLLARILAITDSYDALCTTRPYRNALKHHKVLEILESEQGKKLDPTILACFIKMLGSDAEHHHASELNAAF